MKSSTLVRSALAVVIGGILLSANALAEETLTNKAEKSWDSATQSVEKFGKKAGTAIDNTVQDASASIDDSTITAKIKGKLLNAAGIDSNEISVKTVAGTVYLSGFVKSDSQLNQVTNIAANIEGVKTVQSSIAVIK